MEEITAYKTLDRFFDKYPEQLPRPVPENIAFIETLEETEREVYKTAIITIARANGWKPDGH